MNGSLESNGRRALVTGGTQGIGEAVVARLREVGVTRSAFDGTRDRGCAVWRAM